MFSFRTKVVPLLGLGLMASSAPALAGAWTLEAGTGQAIVTSTFSRANQGFDESRNLHDTPRYNKFELQGLIEYGAANWLTLMFMPSLQHIDVAVPVDARRTGLGYTEFGGRARLMQGDAWVFSLQTTLRMPGTFDKTNPATIGYNDVEVDVRALFGYNFSVNGLPAFIDLQAAQRFRSAGLPSEFRFDTTFGVRVAPDWRLLAQTFSVISEGGGNQNGVLIPSYDYHKLQLSVVYDLTKQWSLQLGGFSTFGGRNALQENALIVGAWYRF